MAAWDAHANFAVSAVATAPSPATSGTSLVVTTGQGTRFPAVPFNATIWPAASQPTPANAEVVRVTAVSTDTLTITRAQEGTSARTVVVGDQISASITAKVATDIENALGVTPQGSFASVAARLAAGQVTTVNPAAVSLVTVPGVALSSVGAVNPSTNLNLYFPFWCEDYVTFDRVLTEVSQASGSAGSLGRVAIYNATASWQPTTLVEDFGTFATDSTGVKTLTPSGGSRTLPGGRYVSAVNNNAGTMNFRSYRGQVPGEGVAATLGALPFPLTYFASVTFGAFAGTGVAWTGLGGAGTTSNDNVVFLRVTAVG